MATVGPHLPHLGLPRASRAASDPVSAHAPRGSDRALPRWWRELLATLAIYVIYDSSRGLRHGDPAAADRHGWTLTGWERSWHLAPEHVLNQFLWHVPPLAVIASYFYAALHFIVTPAVLIWLYRRHPDSYRTARTTLVVATLVALVGFWLFPTTPPRLLPGGAFHDTLAETHRWGWWAGEGSAPRGFGSLTNQLAAMPSLHVGWALWSGWLIARHAHRPMIRALGVAYPPLTALVVMGTANHYLLDAVAGVVVMAIAAATVRPFSRSHRHTQHAKETPVTVDTTPVDSTPVDRGHTADARHRAAQDNPHHARRWLILGVLGIAQLMVVLDATIVNIALPSAQSALHFSDAARQWVITAYALAFGSLLLLGGRIGDVFGRKRIFLIGVVGFAAASAFGGAAPSFEVLVVARALQGLFGALVAPAGLSLLTTTFTDPRERGKAFGIYGAIAGAGGAAGLLLGGVLTEYLSWRWSLYVNVGFAAAAAAGALALLHHEPSADRPHIDIPGAVTVSGGLFALVYGLSHAETHGWGDTTTIAFLAAGAAGLTVFTVLQARVAHPLLPLRVLRDRDRGGSLLAMLTVSVGMFAVFLFLTYYLRTTLGYSAIRTGLAFLPMVGALSVSATLATSTLQSRLGSRPLVAAGFLSAAGGMAWLAQLTLHATYATQILPALIVLGVGSGLVFASAMAAATLGIDAEDAGVASAAVNTAQQVGGSIGTALLSTVAASAASHYLASHPAGGTAVAHATLSGYTSAFWWTAAIFTAAALVVGALLRPGTRPVEAGAPVLVV